jgi:hypothetical protein
VCARLPKKWRTLREESGRRLSLATVPSPSTMTLCQISRSYLGEPRSERPPVCFPTPPPSSPPLPSPPCLESSLAASPNQGRFLQRVGSSHRSSVSSASEQDARGTLRRAGCIVPVDNWELRHLVQWRLAPPRVAAMGRNAAHWFL